MSETPEQTATRRKDFKQRWKERIGEFKDLHRLPSSTTVAEDRQFHKDLGHCPHCTLFTGEQVPSLPDSEILEEVNSDVREAQIWGCRAARKLFCLVCSPRPEILRKDLLSRLVSLMRHTTSHNVHFEAAFALTMLITQRERACTQEELKHRALPEFVFLAASHMLELKVLGVVALGNLYGTDYSDDSLLKVTRTTIKTVSSEIVPQIFEYISPKASTFHLGLVSWMFITLCRYENPYPSLSEALNILPALVNMRGLDDTDMNIMCKISWSFSYLTKNIKDILVACDIIPLMIMMMSFDDLEMVLPALRFIRDLTSDSSLIQTTLDNGVLKEVSRLMKHSNPIVQREATIVAGNIAAGDPYQVHDLIICGVLDEFVQQLHNGDFDIKKEVLLAVKNFGCGANGYQKIALVQFGVLKLIVKMLQGEDHNFILVILEVINIMFKAAEETHILPWLCQLFDYLGGLCHLRMLLDSNDELVHQVAHSLYDDYFTYLVSDDNLNPV